MAILSQTKQGFITFKTVAGYMKWLPRTLATLVTMNDGKSVEEKITQLNGRFAGTGIGDGVALIDKTSYTFPNDGYLVAKASYRQNYYVGFKIVGTNGKTTNEITIGSEVTTNAITNNCVALYVKKGMGINSIKKNSNQYNVIQFYPLV